MKLEVQKSIQVYEDMGAIRVARKGEILEAKRKDLGFKLKDGTWVEDYGVVVIEEDKSIIERIKSWIKRS